MINHSPQTIWESDREGEKLHSTHPSYMANIVLILTLQAVTLKRQLRENEMKIQDQEEELDEQAGLIQQLEQVGKSCK